MTAQARFTLSPEAKAVVDEIILLGGFGSPGQAIQAALGTELFFQRKRRHGWKVYIKNWRWRVLVWPPGITRSSHE